MKTFTWTRTDKIQFDPYGLPHKVYARMVRACLYGDDWSLGISADGRLFIWHEALGRTAIKYRCSIHEEVHESRDDEDRLVALRQVFAQACDQIDAHLKELRHE
jgi:hypothetical protein